MIRTRALRLPGLLVAVLCMASCREVVKPMQVGPQLDPPIAIYHHAKYRGAPTVYLATFTAEALEAWRELGNGEEQTFIAGRDFSLQVGTPVGDVVSITPGDQLDVTGQITVAQNHITVALRINPSSGATQHPIDGQFPYTTRDPVRISVHSPE